jgi:FkbM family methyltransferase
VRLDDPAWRERPLRTAARVAESLGRRRLHALSSPRVTVAPGLRVVADLRSPQGLRLFRYGLQLPEAGLLERLLQPGDVFVDGGANVGLFSLVAARRVGPSGRVLAFEPVPRLAAAARANARLNGFDWIEVDTRALSDSEGDSELVELAGGLSSFAPGHPGGVARRVATARLDSVVHAGPVRLVKLDVEGAEVKALRGARRLLERDRPDLLLEVEPGHLERQGCTPGEIDELLDRLGYLAFEVSADEPPVLSRLPAVAARASGPNVFASADPGRLEAAGLERRSEPNGR